MKNTRTPVNNFAAWRQFYRQLDAHNANLLDRSDITKRIRGGRIETAICIFKDYLKSKNAGRGNEDGWFETSNSLLAEATGHPLRTISGHIINLLEVGFLTGKADEIPGLVKSRSYNFYLKVNADYYVPKPI